MDEQYGERERMAKNSERDKIIKEVTNDILKSKFASTVGSKAHVERHEVSNEHMDSLREVLADIGQNLTDIGVAPRGMAYQGSLSVHVFKAEHLNMCAFAVLSNTARMPFDLADGALRELTGSTLVTYGRNRKRLRSGF